MDWQKIWVFDRPLIPTRVAFFSPRERDTKRQLFLFLHQMISFHFTFLINRFNRHRMRENTNNGKGDIISLHGVEHCRELSHAYPFRSILPSVMAHVNNIVIITMMI